jgi:hypothetical protein
MLPAGKRGGPITEIPSGLLCPAHHKQGGIMKESGHRFLKQLRCLCLMGVIALGLISIVGSNGGDGGETAETDNVDGEEGLVVEVYDASKVYPGTTLLADSYNARIIEVDMSGEIVWEYDIPEEIAPGATIGVEADLLDSGNIQFISGSGIYEITRAGEVVWSYPENKISHDADRLSDGNIIYVYGNNDTEDDAQVKEIDSNGTTVWEWYAKEYYLDRFGDVSCQGWTHANGVQRLANDHTLISLRNFYLTTIVDENGDIVREYDWSSFGDDTDPHEPVMLATGNLLVCLQNDSPYQAVEIDADTGDTVWTYSHSSPLRTARDCDRLPNGNTLIVAVKNNDTTSGDTDPEKIDESTIIEVTDEGEVVWQLTLQAISADGTPGYFYKALRIGNEYTND